MPLTLLLGGARSGKSRLAVRLVAVEGGQVVVIATGEARDEEMAERIRRHRSERPPEWATVEEPLDLEGALERVPDEACVLVDCLTLWVSNLLDRSLSDADIEGQTRKAVTLAASRTAGTVVVTNEVGSGVIPVSALARRYADLLGRVNATWAAAADLAFLVVAGRVLPLHVPEAIVGDLVSD